MEISKEDLEYFGAAVTQLLGVDMPTLKQAITFIQGEQVRSALQPIRDAWGEQFDENFTAVQAYFDTLSDEQKAFYDNPDGLQYLFDKFVAPKMAENSQNTTEATGEVPNIASGQTTGTTPAVVEPTLTREKIQAMSPQEYRENADAITAFYATSSTASTPQAE